MSTVRKIKPQRKNTCKGIKLPKLACFTQFCYHLGSFNNNDNNNLRTLLHTQISPRAGEKRSNRSLSKLTGALGRAFVGATIMLSPMVANANDAPQAKVQTISTKTGSIVFYDDADHKASQWVADNSDRVAVSIRYGGTTTFKPEDIERVLKHDFTENGVPHAVFYWEHGRADLGTGIAVETDDAIFGPFSLGEIRDKIPEIANQIKFNSEIGQQANIHLHR